MGELRRPQPLSACRGSAEQGIRRVTLRAAARPEGRPFVRRDRGSLGVVLARARARSRVGAPSSGARAASAVSASAPCLSGRRSRASVPSQGSRRMKAQGRRGSNCPRAAAVTAGAAAPCWLYSRAATRAAAQLRVLHQTPVTPRPYSGVAIVRLVTGRGTSRTSGPTTSDLPTEHLPGGGQAVHGGPNDPCRWRTGRPRRSERPLPVEDGPFTEVRTTLAGGIGSLARWKMHVGEVGTAVASCLASGRTCRGGRTSSASRIPVRRSERPLECSRFYGQRLGRDLVDVPVP